jgi:hypothetical protein
VLRWDETTVGAKMGRSDEVIESRKSGMMD